MAIIIVTCFVGLFVRINVLTHPRHSAQFLVPALAELHHHPILELCKGLSSRVMLFHGLVFIHSMKIAKKGS